MKPPGERQTVLLHLASGIGNIVLATPLLVALNRLGLVIDLLLDADYPQTADLFRDWSIIRSVFSDPRETPRRSDYQAIIPAIPPFYWQRFARHYASGANIARRPPDQLFYRNEQEYYLTFARQLGYPSEQRPFYSLPIAPSDRFGVNEKTLVIAPGCKTGVMAAKRWPYFTELARRFEDVAVVGTADDLNYYQGAAMRFPDQARLFVGQLTLRETAELMATAGVVVGNDSGLAHLAAAVGASTIILFGPTPDQSLGQFPPNVIVMRSGMGCEPCWFDSPFQACSQRIDCLKNLSAESVEQVIRKHLFDSALSNFGL